METRVTERQLVMWVLYDHPKDHPESFVARRFFIRGDGNLHPDAECITSGSLGLLRREMMQMGLACLTRDEGDDPVIVESWI